jgi:outer membrane protein
MMRKWKLIIFVLILTGVHGIAEAQTMKIGLIDFQRAINEVEEGKRAKAQLKSQFDAKQRTLTAQQESLKKLRDQLEGQRGTLSAEAMKQKEAQFKDQVTLIQKTFADSRNEMATKEAELTQAIIVKMRNVVKSIGQKEGFNLILETSQDTVLYAPQGIDLTSKLIQAYNSGAR